MKKIPLIIIAGPTGIGKSSIGLEVANILKTDLISADSRQIYKYMDIGTAKPTKEEKEFVNHEMIDICEPTDKYTVSEYIEDVKKIIEDTYSKGKIPLLVGGTGLYIKSLIEGYSIPKVSALNDYREELKKEAQEFGNAYLYKKALQIDEISAKKIHENDLFRVIRILEVYEATGEKLSNLASKTENSIYDLTYICLDCNRDTLYKRVENRVDKMIEDGLIDEVKFLVNKYGYDLPILYTLNYREPIDYLKGNISLEECKELMKKNTRNFAKRQLTWFRSDTNHTWRLFENISDKEKIVYELVKKFKN